MPLNNHESHANHDHSHVIGTLSVDGTATLRNDESHINGNLYRPGLETRRSAESSSSDSSKEYGKLRSDPSNVIEGSLGGGYEGKASLRNPRRQHGTIQRDPQETQRPSVPRRKSITVRLEKTDEAGRYLLNTEDPELRVLLKAGIERSGGEFKKPKSRFRDLVFTKQFTAFDRQNPSSAGSPFHGFFTLFWMGIAMMLLKIAANNWRIHGSIFGGNEIVKLMISKDLLVLGLSDGIMCGATVFCLGLQKLVLHDFLSWNRSGWILQNLWQTFYLFAVLGWAQYREWPWTHAVFIVLHCIAMLMKQHSYAFQNGYYSELYKRRKLLEGKLKQLEDPEVLSPIENPKNEAAYATSYFDTKDLNQLTQRRKSAHTSPQDTINVDEDIKNIACAIEEDAPLDFSQLRSLRKLIRFEISNLTDELKGTCTVTQNHYPHNLTLTDFYSYIPLPTVIYELEYPRQDRISWSYVLEKSAATFGNIFIMIIVSQHFMYPIVIDVLRMKDLGIPLSQRLREFPWVFMDLLFPFMLEYILSWYVIWECVLNVLAELTRFADRGFYSDWWNARDWSQFARDWNTPVHAFLLRFAYHSSIASFKLRRAHATFITFLLSACVHELVMAVIFKKLRGYLLMLQMSQIPLVMLTKTKILRGRDTLNNAVFWLGIFIGPSFCCSLYLFL